MELSKRIVKSRRWYLYSVLLVPIVTLLIAVPPNEAWVDSQDLYLSHNLCISHEVDYKMELFVDSFTVNETVILRPADYVLTCYFHGEKFEVHKIGTEMRVNSSWTEWYPLLQLREMGVYSLESSDMKRFDKGKDYRVTFEARKSFHKVGEGLTFKVYRERSTFKRNWYSLIHMSPSQCGKAFFCTNNLRDLHTLRIEATHWETHNLNCAGKTKIKKNSRHNGKVTSICENTFKVGVNNLHYSLTNFPKLEYETTTPDGKPFHHITLVGPTNEHSVMYPQLEEHFKFILRIYSVLLVTINLKHFHAIFYILPNFHKAVPEVFSGSCYFKLENILYNIDIETTQRSYLKCLLHQGYMNERVTDSWVLRYVPEGLFEKLVNTYEVQGVRNDYFRNVLLGDADDLDSLAKYDKYLSQIRLKRPWRKAAGFWDMLASINPGYGRLTYEAFSENVHPIESHEEFVKWVTQHSKLLNLNQDQFLNMLYTWTAPRGYPVLEAKVIMNRTVCVTQYGATFYFNSRIIPFVLEYNYPIFVRNQVQWVNPETDNNCQNALDNLYPYLINGNLRMIGRVLYDKRNWETWASALMKKDVREALTTTQKVTLIMDALYFAQTNRLDWTMSIKFLALVRDETDELAWRSFDQVLTYLESLTRYTTIYPMFKKLIADVVKKYYESREHPTGIAIKWNCMAGVVECLRYTENMTKRAVNDHTYMPNRTEVLCGGMRRLEMQEFQSIIGSLGRPDWREPIFLIDIMLCANNWKILREMMHHLFFHKTWQFRSSLLKNLLVRMIEMGKGGSDAVLYYLDHDPKTLLRELELENLLDVFSVLSKYLRDAMWLKRFMLRLQVNRKWSQKHLNRIQSMFEQLKTNKRWYNMHYQHFASYLVEGYRIQLRRYQF